MAVAVSRFGMIDENSPSVHPFFAPRDCTNPTAHPHEELGSRRKRRRVSSPIPEAYAVRNGFPRSAQEIPNGWENQLRAAAYGEHSPPMGTAEAAQSLKIEPAMDPDLSSKTDKDASSLLQTEIIKPSVDGHGNKIRPPPNEQSSSIAPKTMIAVCAGGKLVSPTSQSLAFNSNTKRKKRDITHEDNSKPKIVKIKYGSSNESRRILAQKIQEIISGTTVEINDETTNPKPVKPTIISKPTHPFFLGAIGRNKDPKDLHRSMVDGDLTSSSVAGKQDMENGLNQVRSVQEVASNDSASASLPEFHQASHGLGKPRSIRYRGAMEPIWPPKEMTHVRPLLRDLTVNTSNVEFRASSAHRKLKYAKVQVAGDREILRSYSTLLHQQAKWEENIKSKTVEKLRRPIRKIMTRSELQAATRSLLTSELSTLQPFVSQDDTPGESHISAVTTHGALLRLFKDIYSSSTAFDRFECETHDWVHKYAPKCAEEVLQSGPEALVLRDWLKSLTITSVGSGSSELHKGRDKSVSSKKLNANFKRKKRKRAEELDGFVISSDEEIGEMEELQCPEISDTGHQFSGKKSVVRVANISGHNAEGQKAANAIVISGPHGCGKTAAVYAVARELDFEVFEINSGSRRSGKDILEKVGDMTKNHLVNQACETKEGDLPKGISDSAERSVPDGELGCRTDSKPVLQSQKDFNKKPRGRPKIHAKSLDTNENLEKKKGKRKEKEKEKQREEEKEQEKQKKKKQKQSQRQSLILLEEVDVLFEEDKQFWSTTLDLILHSKRPIIMTCTDERLLPLDEMILFALLRFTPPPEPLAIDYLILLASSEGHLLSREPLSSLLRSKHFDLRASITELNFFCQMAIGDTKGGLEWMLIQPSSAETRATDGANLRVVSVETYGHNFENAQQSPGRKSLVSRAGNNFPANLRSCNVDELSCGGYGVTPFHSKQSQQKDKQALQRLVAFEQVIDAFSAADTHRFSDYRRNELRPLDPTLPDVSERFRMDFVESSTVIQTEPIVDHSGVSTSLGSAVETYAAQTQYGDYDGAFTLIPDATQHVPFETKITRAKIAAAFGSIAGHSKLPPTMSAFYGPMLSIVQDLAPYIRSIVYSDIKLEEHRLQLNALFAQNGRNGKRMRTTRASHAALEGGSKAHTRRDRWFPVDTNFTLILQSGGDGWQELAWERTLEKQEMDSKPDIFESSIQPTSGSDG